MLYSGIPRSETTLPTTPQIVGTALVTAATALRHSPGASQRKKDDPLDGLSLPHADEKKIRQHPCGLYTYKRISDIYAFPNLLRQLKRSSRRTRNVENGRTIRSVVGLSLAAIVGLGMALQTAKAEPSANNAEKAKLSPGAEAVKAAAKNHKYLFIYFWRDDTQQTREMRGVFQTALAKMADRADPFEIQVGPAEKKLVDALRRRAARRRRWSWPLPPTGRLRKASPLGSTRSSFAKRLSALARPSA